MQVRNQVLITVFAGNEKSSAFADDFLKSNYNYIDFLLII